MTRYRCVGKGNLKWIFENLVGVGWAWTGLIWLRKGVDGRLL